jgi:hypothetical protein
MTQENNSRSNIEHSTFVPPYTLNTAVLFLVFNRLDTTKQVFEVIRQAKPPRLYIAADGARENREGESEKVKVVRDYIASNIDWQCEVKTLFREQNYGCKMAVSGAIDWFFANEEKGIILEDDCLPSQSFFWFCEELLEKYEDDMRVGMISGDNFQNGIKRGDADYYFSIYNHIWGWASWANRWKNYDVELEFINDSSFIDDLLENKQTKKYWQNVFEEMKQQKIDTWDYQWTFSLWGNRQLTVLPNTNLIKNIGFGADATHTTGESKQSNMEHFEIVLKNHPASVERNLVADDFTGKMMFEKKSFFVRVVNKVKRILK